MSFYALFQLHLCLLGPASSSGREKALLHGGSHPKQAALKTRAEEMRTGNLGTEDEDLLLVSPERGLLSSRSSNLTGDVWSITESDSHPFPFPIQLTPGHPLLRFHLITNSQLFTEHSGQDLLVPGISMALNNQVILEKHL